jgi:transcriptional regulator with XRE-family HTH domain
MADLGGLIHSARLAKGITKSQLARLSGVTFMYVSDLENGKRIPTTGDALTRIASILGIQESDIREAAAITKLEKSFDGNEQKVAEGKLALARRMILNAGPAELRKITKILEDAKGGAT